MGRRPGGMVARSEVDRFWELVRQDPTGCWEWQGGYYVTGYGRFAPQQYAQYRAHRYMWSVIYGAIPPGRWVLHRCDNRRCVRPDHLFLGDRQDNVDDAVAKGRVRRREQHGMAKLTQAKADEIRQRASRGETQTALAVQFGVCRTTIHRVLHRADKGGWS